MKMNYILYITTNKINNKIYIGVHKQKGIEFDGYLGCGVWLNRKIESDTVFCRAVKKYGFENFSRKTISSFDTPEEAYNLERIIVNSKFLNRKDTYNVALGGSGGGTYTKSILQYSLSGKFIREFDSSEHAASKLNLPSASNIRLVTDQIGKTYGSSQWRTKTEDFPIRITPAINNKIPVAQYDLEGNFVKLWDSSDKAAKSIFNLNNGQALKKAASSSGLYRDFQWLLIVDDVIPDYIDPYKDPKLILQIDPNNGSIIKEWHDVAELREKFPHYRQAIRGHRKTYKGYIWKYNKDYNS